MFKIKINLITNTAKGFPQKFKNSNWSENLCHPIIYEYQVKVLKIAHVCVCISVCRILDMLSYII